jgi:hypothetical protein
MVIALFRGMCHPDFQHSASSVRELNCTFLRYKTRLRRLHTLGPPLALAFSRSNHSATPDPKQKNNQGTLDKSQVPQADPRCDKIAQLEQEARQEKVTNHMRDNYAKIDIKLKHNSMNIISYTSRQKIPGTWYS